MSALRVQASEWAGNVDENEKKGVKKTETRYTLTAMPKTNLSLDGFQATGMLKTNFNLSPSHTVNVKSVVIYKKGNNTFILPYAVQTQPMTKYHQVQINLPFRKN
ncbi:hypothetical protein ACWKWU_14670 [Chitinophaga lutea]